MGQTRILPGFQSERPGIKLGACCLPGLQNHTLQKSESLFSFSFPFNLFIFSCFYHHFFAHAQTSRFYSPTCLGSPQSLWCYCPGFSSPFVLHVHLQAHSELNQNMELENKKKKTTLCDSGFLKLQMKKYRLCLKSGKWWLPKAAVGQLVCSC